MKNIIQFSIEEGMDGYYIAHALNYAIITQAKSFEELLHNIREATELHLQDADTDETPVGRTPSILVNYELPLSLHVA